MRWTTCDRVSHVWMLFFSELKKMEIFSTIINDTRDIWPIHWVYLGSLLRKHSLNCKRNYTHFASCNWHVIFVVVAYCSFTCHNWQWFGKFARLEKKIDVSTWISDALFVTYLFNCWRIANRKWIVIESNFPYLAFPRNEYVFICSLGLIKFKFEPGTSSHVRYASSKIKCWHV